MIVSWMFSVLAFTSCLALGAAAADTLARAAGRPRRWIWCSALAAGTLWPLIVPLATLALPPFRSVAARLPVVTVLRAGSDLLDSRSALMTSLGRVLLVAWMLLSIVLAIRLARAVVALRQLRARAERRTIDGVSVLLSDGVGPATIGLTRPSVIVPRTMLELEEPLRRLILRHEREHCAAGDPWLLLGAGVAVVLFPWNVALWFIARRLRLALEIDCDARVLAAGAEPTRYAQLLLWIAQHPGTIPLAPMLTAGQSHLERRIVAMRTRLARPRLLHMVVSSGALVVAVIAACSEGAPDGPLANTASASASRSASAPTSAASPYFEFQVQNQARQIPTTGHLTYPASMRAAHREGEVLAQFVVDERGVVDLGTFKVLKSSGPEFTAAVHDALSDMRFSPAHVGGKAVRQVVQQPFTFSLRRN